MKPIIRTTAVIARRDFIATVMSRTFLLFLLAPLFPILFGVIFGSIGANVTKQAPTGDDARIIAVYSDPARMKQLSTAHDRLEAAQQTVPGYTLEAVQLLLPDAKSAQALLDERRDVAALLTYNGPEATLYGRGEALARAGPYVRLLMDESARDRALKRAGMKNIDQPDLETLPFPGTALPEKDQTPLLGQIAQTLLFMLTLMLAGVLLSNFIEEKGNKVIEVLAAAAPIPAIFTGKLFAMLGSSLVGILVWSLSAVIGASLILHQGLSSLPTPETGWTAFITLGFLYFSTNYLLLGALLLGIGAQASSVRQIQTISLPITMAQLLLYGLASAAFHQPNGAMPMIAAVFPFSSPLAMIAYAAREPAIWPHVLALLWQILWVALTITITARWFRRGVLKSGPARRKAVQAS